MKWIGKNIWNFISRFRADVWVEKGADFYLADRESTGDYFKISGTSSGATTLSTVDDSGTAAHLEIEADGNITLDSAGDIALECAGGDLTCDADTITFTSGSADDPTIIIKNTADDNQAARIQMRKDRGAAMADNDRIGEIDFFGEDASQNSQQYGKIQVKAVETTHGQETGKLDIFVAQYDGGIGLSGFTVKGTTTDGTIDVDLGKGAASTTTVAGDLAVTTGLILDSVDVTTIQTSGESFADNDTSLMTSAAIDDKINTKYSYVYMTWSASGSSSMDGDDPEWVFPNTAKGIYEEDWTKDENIKATTTGFQEIAAGGSATQYTTTRQTAVNAFVVPHTGYCVGFHAHGRNDDNDASFKAGLFHYEGSTSGATNNGGIDYGATGSTCECTLRWIATAEEGEASGGADGTSAHSFKGACKLVSNTDALAVTAGDALMPAIMGPDGSDEIFVTMTIILKIPITTV